MTKYNRTTGKVFGANANATGDNPEIGQFGSAKDGSYIGTSDVSTIQALPAWGKGWVGAVTPETNFPPLPEMTGAMKVLSEQICYLLQNGIAEWDFNTIYYENNFVRKNSKIYYSLSDENQGNDPETSTINWRAFNSGSNMPLLTSIWSDHLLNDMSWLRADTFSWQDGNTYTSVYKELEQEYATGTTEEISGITFKRTTSGFKIADVSQEQAILDLYNSNGIAWYYILDTTNKRFKLPRTKWGFKGLRGNVGDYINQNVLLPNITGQIGGQVIDATEAKNNITTGAFYRTTTSNLYGVQTTSLNVYKNVGMKASLSSSVYSGDGTNTLIDERATQMYLYFYVGNYTQTAIEQTAGLNADLFNNKLDLNASNLNTQGKSLISGLGMPSSRYIDLTLGASGSTYTAPANGWFSCNCQCTQDNPSNNIFFALYNNSNETGDMKWFTNTTNLEYKSIIPCRKGDILAIGYNAKIVFVDTWERGLRFYYAEGEV